MRKQILKGVRMIEGKGVLFPNSSLSLSLSSPSHKLLASNLPLLELPFLDSSPPSSPLSPPPSSLSPPPSRYVGVVKRSEGLSDLKKISEKEGGNLQKRKLRTEWKGEMVGTLARVEEVRRPFWKREERERGREREREGEGGGEGLSDSLVLQLKGVSPFSILNLNRSLFGYFTGDIQLIEEVPEESEIILGKAQEAKNLVSQCYTKLENFRDFSQFSPESFDPSKGMSELRAFSYALAERLPMRESDKQKMLTSSTLERLEFQNLLMRNLLLSDHPIS